MFLRKAADKEIVMTMKSDQASKLLAFIRLFNGSSALLIPEAVLKRLGGDPRHDSTAIYPLRMFGVRTVLLGTELLILKGEERRRAARRGIVIHGSDVFAAATAGVRGQMPKRVALATVLISSVNTYLAAVASRS
jgi:predicted nucleic acid-binding protein